jgi:hypothetical protein
MYHLTLRSIYATDVAVEKQYFIFQKCVFEAFGFQHAKLENKPNQFFLME